MVHSPGSRRSWHGPGARRACAVRLGGAEVLVDQGDLGVLPLDRAADDAAALAVLRPVAVGGVRREGEEGPVEGRECPGRGGRLLGKCKERRKVARMW